jgi:phenylacetic acid degradation operon negative regulatory protein
MIRIPEPHVRHQQLIITLYGLYSRESGDALAVSALIEMLGDLGYDAPGVRSSVSRLKAKGVLKSVKAGNVAKYELAENVAEVFREGDERIFSPTPKRDDDGWVLAIFSVPESMRSRRHQLRTVLSGFGFGFMASGVWIAPLSALERTKKQLDVLGLSQFVDFFRGDYIADHTIRAKVAQWWDMADLDEQFGAFLGLYGDGVEQWTSLLGDDPERALAQSTPEIRQAAFRYYIPMLTIWRRFPYKDPNLPPEYLPDDWKGMAARDAFLEVHRLIAPMAAAHARHLMS